MQTITNPFLTSLLYKRVTSVSTSMKAFLLLLTLSLYSFNSTYSQTCTLKATVTAGVIKCNGSTTTLTVDATGG